MSSDIIGIIGREDEICQVGEKQSTYMSLCLTCQVGKYLLAVIEIS